MIKISHVFINRLICITVLGYAMTGGSVCMAWGPDGHSAVGILAMNQLNGNSRSQLQSVIGPLDTQAMVKACNWPDEVEDTDEWEWAAPQHYLNIPRGDFTYQQSRDCPTRLCVTEKIKDYAAQLADPHESPQNRWQAFAWLCHLTGDLHQPLHAGFGDDRGGNQFEVVVNGETTNLHTFWDSIVISENAGGREELIELLTPQQTMDVGSDWSWQATNDWTNESHELAKTVVYPENVIISENFQQRSWELVQQQINLAANRLALIINSVFATTE